MTIEIEPWSFRRLIANVGLLLASPVIIAFLLLLRALLRVALPVVIAVRVWWWKRTIKRRLFSLIRAHHRGERVPW